MEVEIVYVGDLGTYYKLTFVILFLMVMGDSKTHGVWLGSLQKPLITALLNGSCFLGDGIAIYLLKGYASLYKTHYFSVFFMKYLFVARDEGYRSLNKTHVLGYGNLSKHFINVYLTSIVWWIRPCGCLVQILDA